MKRCKTCGSVKPLDDFYADARLSDGRKSECKQCTQARVKAWGESNRDKTKKYKKAWSEKNEAKHVELRKQWVASNRGKSLAINAKRRAKRLGAIPSWADLSRIESVYLEAGRRIDAGEDVHVDHVVPLCSPVVCGLHVHENLRIVPANVNRSKSTSFDGGW